MTQEKTVVESIQTYGLKRPEKMLKGWWLYLLAVVARLRQDGGVSSRWDITVTDRKGKYWDGAVVERGLTPLEMGRYLLHCTWGTWESKHPESFKVKYSRYTPDTPQVTAPPEEIIPFMGPVQRTQDTECAVHFTRGYDLDKLPEWVPTAKIETAKGVEIIPINTLHVQHDARVARRNKNRVRMATKRAAEHAAMVDRASKILDAMVEAKVAEQYASRAIAEYGTSGAEFARGKSASTPGSGTLAPIASDDMYSLAAIAAVPSEDIRNLLHCDKCGKTYTPAQVPDKCCGKRPHRETGLPTLRQYGQMARAIAGDLRRTAKSGEHMRYKVHARTEVTVVQVLPKLPNHRRFPVGSIVLCAHPTPNYYKCVYQLGGEYAWEVTSEPCKPTYENSIITAANAYRRMVEECRNDSRMLPCYNPGTLLSEYPYTAISWGADGTLVRGVLINGNQTLNSIGLAPIQALVHTRSDSPELSQHTYGAIATYRTGSKGMFTGVKGETVCRAKRESIDNQYIDGRVATHEVFSDVGQDIVLSRYSRANMLRKSKGSAGLKAVSLTVTPRTAVVPLDPFVWGAYVGRGMSVRRFAVPPVEYPTFS